MTMRLRSVALPICSGCNRWANLGCSTVVMGHLLSGLKPSLQPVYRYLTLRGGHGMADARRHVHLQALLRSGLAVGGFGGGKRDLRALYRIDRVILAAQDQQGARRDSPQHVGAVELPQD